MTATVQSNESSTPDASGDSASTAIRDGIVGGVSGIILSFLPFSTVLAGGIAGYLQATDEAGTAPLAGGLAGGIAFLPHVIVGSYLIIAPAFVPPGPDLGLPPGYLLVGVIGFGVFYAVGLGMLGAILGGYLRREHLAP